MSLELQCRSSQVGLLLPMVIVGTGNRNVLFVPNVGIYPTDRKVIGVIRRHCKWYRSLKWHSERVVLLQQHGQAKATAMTRSGRRGFLKASWFVHISHGGRKYRVTAAAAGLSKVKRPTKHIIGHIGDGGCCCVIGVNRKIPAVRRSRGIYFVYATN